MNGAPTDIPPPEQLSILTVAQAANGPPIPPQQRILLYSADEWEDFIQEWVHSIPQGTYADVKRFTGAGDRGIDIAGFTDSEKLQGIWDNYQCKHYNHALRPTDAWPEIGKVLWYTFKKEYRAPRGYFFVAPWGAGTTLQGYFSDKTKLKEDLFKAWDKNCRKKITETQEISLEGEFLAHAEAFDYSIFDCLTSLQIIDGHRKGPYFASRFGGGLPTRPAAEAPPDVISPVESRYIGHLLNAYADHKDIADVSVGDLSSWPPLQKHFRRQREAFYQAENLRVFSRDSVPPGTFEALQQNIYDGVVDVHDADHPDGFVRVCKVTESARQIQITANVLIACTNPADRDGICHQLANEDRLTWKKP